MNHPDQVARMSQWKSNQRVSRPSGQYTNKKSYYALEDKIVKWHYDRNLIEGSTDKDQLLKLIQEVGELSDHICKGVDISDDVGDCLVVLINICERNGLLLTECLAKAWEDIKDRRGEMRDGIFVKEADL